MDTNVDFLEEISKFIFTSRYARYNEKKQRRNTWSESIAVLEKMHIDFLSYLSDDDKKIIKGSFDLVRDRKVSPSMRSIQFAGKAILAHNARIYNCAVRHVDSLRSFAEIFYLLLCGCGVGIGLSKFFLNRLPYLVGSNDKTGTIVTYVVEDSIEGWSDSIEALLSCYFKNTPYTGRKIVFDYSRIRKKGSPLKTGGGKAPGYKGLKACHKKVKELLDYIIETNHQIRLEPINAYDIIMHCSDAVLSGGIRRSATSIIFDKDDNAMINAKIDYDVIKKGRFEKNEKDIYEGYVIIDDPCYQRDKRKIEVSLTENEYEYLTNFRKISWFKVYPHRARSNNSVLLLRNETSLEEFKKIVERTKQYGEPGFVFADHPWTLYNPCFEIGFIPVTADGVCGVQFCNLSSINGAKIKTKEDFFAAAKVAAIIGTLQAAYTYFPYLSVASQKLTSEEALLGVSITGIMDSPDILLNKKNLQEAARIVVETNKEWAIKLGINPAARNTCIKPEGTNSLVVKSASGAHAHHARDYFRRVQNNKLDPVYKYFKKHNPHMCEESVWSSNKTDDIITFPIKVSDNVIIKDDLTAAKHLDIVKTIQQNWVVPGTTDVNKKAVHHNVSCTIEVDNDEWDFVEKYIYDNRKYFSALSLLPKIGDKIFNQAPMERITTEEDKQKWNEIVSKFTPVDYTKLIEEDDETNLQSELACAGGKCEVFV